jgi:hypothetical protein
LEPNSHEESRIVVELRQVDSRKAKARMWKDLPILVVSKTPNRNNMALLSFKLTSKLWEHIRRLCTKMPGGANLSRCPGYEGYLGTICITIVVVKITKRGDIPFYNCLKYTIPIPYICNTMYFVIYIWCTWDKYGHRIK